MDKGTKLIYSSLGFKQNNEPLGDPEDIAFDQFVNDGNKIKLIGINRDGHIRTINPEYCKLVKPEEYFGEKPETPILG